MSQPTHSENINEIVAALSKAQGTMHSAEKDKVNPHFKSDYATLDALIKAAKPALSSNGLAIFQSTIQTESGLLLVTTLAHSSGQWVKSYMPVLPEKNTPQAMGSALTYAKRQTYGAIIGLAASDDDTDDDGNEASAPDAKKNPAPQAMASSPKTSSRAAENVQHPKELPASRPATPAQRFGAAPAQEIVDKFRKRGVSPAQILARYGAEKLTDLATDDIAELNLIYRDLNDGKGKKEDFFSYQPA